MNLAEAHHLACIIHQSRLAKLITIGHFIPIEAITDQSPWACAVQLPNGQLKTIWSAAEWAGVANVARRSASAESSLSSSHDSPSREPAPTLSPSPLPLTHSPRPDDVHRRQPTLF